jgi:hypothetical protein
MQIDSTHRCILTICDAFHSRMPFDNCQEFSFLQEIEVFYPFHQFFHNRLQHSTHTLLFETCPKIPYEAEKLRHTIIYCLLS